MSEEILYIDDGELVYYINENEFITCNEIPYPMLEGIKHLQQKVAQLVVENANIKRKIDELQKDNKNLYKIICKNCNDLKTTDEEYESLKRVQKLKENNNG